MASGAEATQAVNDRTLRDLGRIQITSDRPLLSEGEGRVLELRDQIEDNRLRRAIIQASSEVNGSKATGEKLQKDLDKAERSLLEARAIYLLQNYIVDDVVMIDPILKAVYASPFNGSRERDLHSAVNQRDVLSMTHGVMTGNLHDVHSRLMSTQVESIKMVEENQKLAHDVRTLADQLRGKDPQNVDDEGLKEELLTAEAELQKAKKRRKLIKGVVGAVVAGSGIDWSQDERLLKLVLEEET